MPIVTRIYTVEEAAQHNTPDDCWVVVDGKVYDVSSYLDEHPGGDDVLLRATGKDATEEFEDAGHSRSARELMEKFFIGEVYEETSTLIPELTITHKKHEGEDISSKILNLSKQYWVLPVAAVSLSMVVVGYLKLRSSRNS